MSYVNEQSLRFCSFSPCVFRHFSGICILSHKTGLICGNETNFMIFVAKRSSPGGVVGTGTNPRDLMVVFPVSSL